MSEKVSAEDFDGRADQIMDVLQKSQADADKAATGQAGQQQQQNSPQQAAGESQGAAGEGEGEGQGNGEAAGQGNEVTGQEGQPPATGEGEGQSDAGKAAQAVPPIEAPKSWNAEGRAMFAKIPDRAIQEYILNREAERDREVNRVQGEVGNLKTAAEQERAELFKARGQKIEELNTAITAVFLSDPILQEGSRMNWQQLANENPALFTQKKAAYDARMQAVNSAAAYVRNLQAEQQTDVQRRMAQHLTDEHNKLVEKVPEWKGNPEVARKGLQEIIDHANTAYGITRQDLDNTADHRALLVLRDAMSVPKLQQEIVALKAENARLKAAPGERQQQTQQQLSGKRAPGQAPRSATPGAQRESGSGSSEAARKLKTQAIRSGKDADRVNAVMAVLGAS